MIQTDVVLEEVRHILNEYPAGGDDYELETAAALGAFLDAALRLLVNELNPAYVGAPTALSDVAKVRYQQRPDGLYYGVIGLPQDYLRFVSLKLAPWPAPVRVLNGVGGPLHQSQFSEAAGVGNGERMPLAFITTDQVRAIEAHAVRSIDTGLDEETGEEVVTGPAYELRYVAAPSVSEGAIALNEKALDALAYMTAGLYLQSRDDVNGADRCIATAKSYVDAANKELV